MRDFDFYFFDLYHTLVLLEPNPVPEDNESAILGIDRSVWTRAAMQDYERRATGVLRDPEEIVAAMVRNTGVPADRETLARILDARKRRYRRTFSLIRPSILTALASLHAEGKKLVLVSNADVLDSLYWEESPLSRFFHGAIFSWEAGCMKPDRRIYELAMERVGAEAARSVFIGDGGHDELAGAKAIGMKTVLTTELIVDFWPHRIPRLAQDADLVIRSLAELVPGPGVPPFLDAPMPASK